MSQTPAAADERPASPPAEPAAIPPRPLPVSHWKALDPVTLVARYRVAIERLDARVFELEHAELDRVFDEGEGVGSWPCRFLLCHVADADLVFTHRIRRTLSEERPVLALWDHAAFWDSPLYGQRGRGPGGRPVLEPPGALAASVHTLRMWTAATLFQLDEADWSRRALHPDLGEVTVRDLVSYAAWHFDHHAAFLNAKLERMLGPRATAKPEACDEGRTIGGCGPGCGCVSEAEREAAAGGGGSGVGAGVGESGGGQ